MDMSYCSSLQLQEDTSSFLFDCDALLDKSYEPLAYDPSSDPGYFSACSSLSPTSSVDSFCFSPTLLQVKTEQDALDGFIFSSPPAPQQTTKTHTLLKPASTTTSASKKSRSRYPGKKRETASEREKLRMRNLTKAMHHLRSYLPPSVALVGQTLTKIDTLRLTIRYISHLSAQLGLTEEILEQRTSSVQPSAMSQIQDQPLCSYSQLQETPCSRTMQPTCSSPHMSSLQVPSGLCHNTEQYWMPQQQFHGQC